MGVLVLPRLQRRTNTDVIVVAATLLFALATAAPGFIGNMFLLMPALFLGGLAWMAVMSNLNVSAQSAAPNWVRARALAVYLLVFQGGMALGSFMWGSVAGIWGNGAALAAANAAAIIPRRSSIGEVPT